MIHCIQCCIGRCIKLFFLGLWGKYCAGAVCLDDIRQLFSQPPHLNHPFMSDKVFSAPRLRCEKSLGGVFIFEGAHGGEEHEDVWLRV